MSGCWSVALSVFLVCCFPGHFLSSAFHREKRCVHFGLQVAVLLDLASSRAGTFAEPVEFLKDHDLAHRGLERRTRRIQIVAGFMRLALSPRRATWS